MKKYSILKYILIIVPLFFLTFFSIGFGSFFVRGEAKEENVQINAGDSAVCYTKSDNQKYTTIEKGISVANSKDTETLVVNLGANASISSNITIDNGTTLLIPHNDSLSTYTFNKTGSAVKKTTVNLLNGADINVNVGGTLILGGTFGTSGINGDYSQINLGKDSSIVVNGTAQIYGNVVETDPIFGNKVSNNILYDNSLDINRFLNVTSTGVIESIFSSYDMGSGSKITNNINNNICPTYKFNFKNLQTYVKIDHGGQMKVMAYVEISGTAKNALCGLVGPNGSSTQYLFYTVSGSVSFEFCNSAKTLIYLNGEVNIGSLYIDVGVAVVDSKKFYLPISSLFDVYVDGVFNTNSKSIKFLPGSKLTISNGSVFNIHGTGTGSQEKSNILFYNANTLISLGITNQGTIDSEVVNNGEINVNQYGAVAGVVGTSITDGTSKIDLTNLTDPANLELSTKEGDSAQYDTPILDFKGPFYDVSNTSTYISISLFEASTLYNSHNGLACYDGEINRLQKVNINVNSTNYKHSAYEYTFYTNTVNSDEGAKTVYEGINNISSNTLDVSNKSYIKLIDSKCDYITIDGSPYVIGSWYQVTKATNIIIQPKEAFIITCNHTNGASGAGSIIRSITYGPDASNMTLTESSNEGKEIKATMPVGWSFKVSDNAKVSGTSKVEKTTYDADGNPTTTVLSTISGKIAWSSSTIYVADGDYLFTSDNVTCIAEGSLILMADNSQKKVEDLVVGDIVKVFNHETGKIDVSPIIFITHDKEEAVNTGVLKLNFDKGNYLEIINDHSIFDKTTNKYEVINYDNVNQYIGHDFVINLENEISSTKLISFEYFYKSTRVYCPVTAFHMDLFVNGLLTMPTFPNDIKGLYNIFELDNDMKYDAESKANDIYKYGLFTYEEFIKIIYISKEAFNVSPAIYLKVSLGKGLITEEQIKEGIEFLLSNDLIE